jgi:hypothetical protein
VTIGIPGETKMSHLNGISSVVSSVLDLFPLLVDIELQTRFET